MGYLWWKYAIINDCVQHSLFRHPISLHDGETRNVSDLHLVNNVTKATPKIAPLYSEQCASKQGAAHRLYLQRDENEQTTLLKLHELKSVSPEPLVMSLYL